MLIFNLLIVVPLIILSMIPKVHKNKAAVAAVFVVYTFILAIRYGQGSDYFAYELIFNQCNSLEAVFSGQIDVHAEILFQLICVLFNPIGFKWFVVLVSIFQMTMLYRFCTKYSDNPLLSFAIAYPTLYSTYFFSTMRQGLTMSIFLGLMYPLLKEKKYVPYYLLAAFCVGIHSSSAVYALVPVVRSLKLNELWGLDLLCLVAGTAITLVFLVLVHFETLSGTAKMYLTSDVSIVSLGVRIFKLLILYTLMRFTQNSEAVRKNETMLKMYATSLIMYELLMWSPIISSRLAVFYEVVGIALLPNLLDVKPLLKKAALAITACLILVMTYKNISAYVWQGEYTCSTLEYPYVTVFNADKIYEYRRNPYERYWFYDFIDNPYGGFDN